jgi:hypothetical protein
MERKPLSEAKVGDRVGIYWRGILLHVRPVSKVTPKLVYCGESGYSKEDGFQEKPLSSTYTMHLPTEQELATWDARIAEEERVEAERKAYLQREDVQLASRLASTDNELWLKLGVERLREIVRQLETQS